MEDFIFVALIDISIIVSTEHTNMHKYQPNYEGSKVTNVVIYYEKYPSE